MSCFILWKNRSLAGASLPASDLVEHSGHSECQSLRDLRVFKYKFDGPFQGWSGPGAHGLQNLFFFFCQGFLGEKISGWYLHTFMQQLICHWGAQWQVSDVFCRQSGRRMAYNNMSQGVLKGFLWSWSMFVLKAGMKIPKRWYCTHWFLIDE